MQLRVFISWSAEHPSTPNDPFKQVLVQVCSPPPQVTLHSPKSVQSRTEGMVQVASFLKRSLLSLISICSLPDKCRIKPYETELIKEYPSELAKPSTRKKELSCEPSVTASTKLIRPPSLASTFLSWKIKSKIIVTQAIICTVSLLSFS